MSMTWNVNITPAERAARVTLGLLGAIGGALLITAAGSTLAGVLELLLVAAGLDLLITGLTGLTGHCPLYQKLGHVPVSLKVHQP